MAGPLLRAGHRALTGGRPPLALGASTTLADRTGRVVLWLHARDTDHDHPAMRDGPLDHAGQGVVVYIKVADLSAAPARATALEAPIIEELHENSMAGFSEFTVASADGYHFAAHSESKYPM